VDTIGQQFLMGFSMNHGPSRGAWLSLDSYTIVAEIHLECSIGILRRLIQKKNSSPVKVDIQLHYLKIDGLLRPNQDHLKVHVTTDDHALL
jgi:hypothetical protein